MNFFLPPRLQGPRFGGNPGLAGQVPLPYGAGLAQGGWGMGAPKPMPGPQMPFGGPSSLGMPRPQAPVQFGGGDMGQMWHPGGGGVPLSGLRSYKYGTPYVPETGPAMLHSGEMVIPANKAKKLRKVPLSSLLKLK